MKATLEFNLDDIDDAMAHKRAVQSQDMAVAIWHILHNTKKGIEYDIEAQGLSAYDALDITFEKIYEILSEHGINIEQLTR